MNQLQPQPHIKDLQPYRPGMPIEHLAEKYNLNPKDIIKLASNENPRGMSPKIAQNASSLLNEAARYPDGQALLRSLADRYNINAENVILGNGSNDILDLVARVFLGRNTKAISSQFGFSVYQLLTHLTGAENVIVDALNHGYDLETMAAAITTETCVIWIANPNNPTGTFISANDIRLFLSVVPKNIIVVLDEAYYEYLDPKIQSNSTEWINEFPNLVITRTFSKAYGLAGLRVGYGMANKEIIKLLNRVRQPFNVNGPGIKAASIALEDTAFVSESYQCNQAGLLQLMHGCDQLDLLYLPAFGNFLTVEFANAALVNEALLRCGIIVRPLLEYGLPSYLRVSVGSPEENDRLLDALKGVVRL
jgi:histidinol-phosphate aminotransferase